MKKSLIATTTTLIMLSSTIASTGQDSRRGDAQLGRKKVQSAKQQRTLKEKERKKQARIVKIKIIENALQDYQNISRKTQVALDQLEENNLDEKILINLIHLRKVKTSHKLHGLDFKLNTVVSITSPEELRKLLKSRTFTKEEKQDLLDNLEDSKESINGLYHAYVVEHVLFQPVEEVQDLAKLGEIEHYLNYFRLRKGHNIFWGAPLASLLRWRATQWNRSLDGHNQVDSDRNMSYIIFKEIGEYNDEFMSRDFDGRSEDEPKSVIDM